MPSEEATAKGCKDLEMHLYAFQAASKWALFVKILVG